MVRAGVWMLLLVSLMLIANQALFMHLAVDSQGVLVRHAHPFHRGDSPQADGHTHTPVEWVLFDGLLHWFGQESLRPVDPAILQFSVCYPLLLQFVHPAPLKHRVGRSPPFLRAL